MMSQFQHPELIVFSLDANDASALFAAMIAAIKQGESWVETGIRELNIGDNKHRIKLRPVDETQHPVYLGFAMGHLTFHVRIGELKAVQVCWPDECGDFPFDPNCNPRLNELQPRLDIPLSARETRAFLRRYGS